MLRLIANLVAFAAGLVVIYWLLYGRVPAGEREHLEREDVFLVWGDSRTYRGLDLELLSAEIGRPVVGYAQHGAGVYDFLVFVNRVPANCDAIVGPSMATVLRDKVLDYHRSGLSFWALAQLALHGYSRDELVTIFLNNRDGGLSAARRSIEPYPDAAEPEVSSRRLEIYRSFNTHRQPVRHYRDKLELVRVGVRRLLEKGCSITLVDFPVTERLYRFGESSVYADYLDWTKEFVDRGVSLLAPRSLPATDNIFYDLSHLNARGRTLMTRWIVERLGVDPKR